MSRQAALIKNTLIIAFGKISTQFLTFLLLPLYTTYLATSEFGIVDLAMTYVTLFAPIITVSLEAGIFRFLIDARGDFDEQKKIISSALRFITFTGVASVLVYFLVHFFISVPYGFYVTAVTVAVILSNIFLQIARGLGDNVNYTIAGMVASITTIVANVVLIVVMRSGVEGMFIATFLANIACTTYLFIVLKLYRYINFRIYDKKLTRRLLRYSIPLVPDNASYWAVNTADRTIISIFLGVMANGIYAVACRFSWIINGLFSFFYMSWAESASVHINSPDRDVFFSKTINASVRLFGSLGLAMIAVLPVMFNLFVGVSFGEAYMYVPLLILGSFLNSIVGLYNALYIAKKMTKQIMNTSIVAATVSVMVSLVGIRFIGLYAPAIAIIVAYLSMMVYRYYDMKKYVTIRYEVKTFLALALLYAVAISLYYMNTLVGNIANIIIIGTAVFLLNRSVAAVLWKGVVSKGREFTKRRRRVKA